MRLGVLGGTFDPVHQGHLDVARAARAALRLDRVLFVPSRVPTHRHAPSASASHRFAMVALALQHEPALSVSDIEMTDSEPAYTDTTLDRLQRGGLPMRDVFFVAGADAFAGIRTWRNFPAVLDRCHFLVVSRPGHPAGLLRHALPELAARMVTPGDRLGREPAIVLVEAPTAAISASEIRRRVAAAEPVGDLVPAAVAEYIRKQKLYSSGERRVWHEDEGAWNQETHRTEEAVGRPRRRDCGGARQEG